MSITLLPVLEVAAPAIDWDQVGPSPFATFWQNPSAWEEFQAKILRLSGFADHRQAVKGSKYLRIDDWQPEGLRRLINAHLGATGDDRMPVEESCALFGGGVLFIDNVPVLFPQCCSTIATVYDWKPLLVPQFQEGYFCLEGHPAPKAIREEEYLTIICEDEGEDFYPPTPPVIRVKVADLAVAVEQAEWQMQRLCEQVNALSAEFGAESISRYLIQGV
ncbi:hypothetical protein [Hymenobacter psychrophilus]|uniref:Uncharacterized protein n=1 Tax=Hymenobacter psychrophilus TaxID=651662 RepID=A0A1H3EES1_9BACT|nr:hypothetical protein [Hymenobacter psychrophilus]SDX76424.1 hypothetical protein SAMN04488069_10377 [Hymenobacter psychrophilus]